MNRDCTAPASSSMQLAAPHGGGMLLRTSGILYITRMIAMQGSLKFFAERYLRDIYQLSASVPDCLGATTGQWSGV
jgi:hypothetical protein